MVEPMNDQIWNVQEELRIIWAKAVFELKLLENDEILMVMTIALEAKLKTGIEFLWTAN